MNDSLKFEFIINYIKYLESIGKFKKFPNIKKDILRRFLKSQIIKKEEEKTILPKIEQQQQQPKEKKSIQKKHPIIINIKNDKGEFPTYIELEGKIFKLVYREKISLTLYDPIRTESSEPFAIYFPNETIDNNPKRVLIIKNLSEESETLIEGEKMEKEEIEKLVRETVVKYEKANDNALDIDYYGRTEYDQMHIFEMNYFPDLFDYKGKTGVLYDRLEKLIDNGIHIDDNPANFAGDKCYFIDIDSEQPKKIENKEEEIKKHIEQYMKHYEKAKIKHDELQKKILESLKNLANKKINKIK